MIGQVLLLTLLESSSESNRAAVFLLGPAAAVAFFSYVWYRYRNANKSYQFEERTDVRLSDIKEGDQKVGRISRTRERWISGYSDTSDPRVRIRRF